MCFVACVIAHAIELSALVPIVSFFFFIEYQLLSQETIKYE